MSLVWATASLTQRSPVVEPAVLQFGATVVSVLQVINATEFEYVIVLLLHRYWAAIASPLFVMLLILKGSGVPMQEKQVTIPFLLGRVRDGTMQYA